MNKHFVESVLFFQKDKYVTIFSVKKNILLKHAICISKKKKHAICYSLISRKKIISKILIKFSILLLDFQI